MSLLSQRLKRLRGSVRVSVLVSLLVGVLVPAFLWAGAPAWWATRGVVTPGATADDYAAVNQGQVKNVAKQGYEEMKAKLPGGAGSALDAVWATPVASTDDYRAINLGQLKAVAEPFYARLQALGYTGQPLAAGKTRPWTGIGADDYALANIGQVKNLFSFDLSTINPIDYDNDGLPNAWEIQYGLDPIDRADAVQDLDGDGLTNLQEYILRVNPFQANILPDTDQDGMPDAYETLAGLNIALDESLEDKDGDRVPNIFEFKRGTMANDPASKPQATFIVNPATGNSSTTDNIYATITQAVQAANEYTYDNGKYTYPNAYAVIEVRSGSYAEQVYLNGQPVLLLGELGSLQGPPVILGRSDYDDYSLRFETATVVDGFIIAKTLSRKGGGVYVGTSYGSTSKRRRLVNCVIRGNETTTGGGVYNNATNLDLVHCTILANKGTSQGRAIYNASSSTLNLINSIVWGNIGTATQEIFKASSSTSIVTVTQSIVAGGEQGGINADPQLTSAGWLRSTSPAIDRAGVAMVVSYDIHGEARPVGTTPDLGADEYKDNNGASDGDGLPDWFEPTAASGASGDADGDGLTNSDEYLRGTNPQSEDSDEDGLNDGAEVTAGTSPLNPDSDGDGMTDGYEVTNLLNPLVDDSLEDKDGDRVPNIFEFKRGTMANDPASKPQATFIVNPASGSSSTTDNIYATITEAVEAANYYDYNYDNGQYTYPNAYAVIEVRSGSYAEQAYLTGQPVLLLGELGSLQGPPVILGRSDYDDYSLRLESASVVESFIITKTLGRKGGGVYVASSYDSTSKRRRLVNCVIQGNETSYGGGVYNNATNLDLVHCTILANKGTSQGRAIYTGSSGTLNLINSIVWGNTGTATQEIFKDSSSTNIVTVTQSIVAGGEQGGINSDPQLTSAGWLRSTSPAINRAGVVAVVAYDIHGESRPVGTTPDLGADEYKDNNGTSDGDGLPDWAETPSASGASDDADGDGLTNSDEYLRGTNPKSADSDGDGLNDGAEVTAGTNPLNPDSDGDGMTDGYEVTNLLNPLFDDSLEDKDGDRVPNIFEFKWATLANAPASKPQSTFIVNPATGNSSTTDNIYATITQAVQAANEYTYDNGKLTYPNSYAVIEVLSGSYTEQVYLRGQPVLLLGELGSLQGPPLIMGNSDYEDYSLRFETASVVDAFIITKTPGRKGGGIYVGTSYGSTSNRRRLVNCVIRGNETSYGGGVYNNATNLDLVHCTILANKGTSQGRAIYNGSGTLNLINSIVWGNTGTATQEIFKASSSIVTVTQSIVAGGEQGGINADPQLTPIGWLRSTSPAINRAGVVAVVSYDIHGEARPVGTTPDLGADEYKDNNGTSDGDGLPDWAEAVGKSGPGDDADGDGLANLQEYQDGLNPRSSDTDEDGLSDGAELSAQSNPLSRDTDLDGLLDGAEVLRGTGIKTPDSDGDGLLDGKEVNQLGTDPLKKDTDGDGMPDAWEVTYGINPLVNDAALDADQDLVSNLREYQLNIDPSNSDTDGDGFYDGLELTYSFLNPAVWNNPDDDSDHDGMGNLYEAMYGLILDVNDASLDPDADGLSNLQEHNFESSPVDEDIDADGLNDAQELAAGTDSWVRDTDGDGLSDGWEIQYGMNPKVAQASNLDSDNDGVKDSEESRYGTHPFMADTDGDGVNDGAEVANKTDPTDDTWGGIPPAAPSNLVETANPNGSITFTWTDNSNNEKGFIIFRLSSDGSEQILGEVPPNATSFTIPPPAVP
jgi:hypothetical protein